jgi:hypothetical protein
VVFAVAGLRVGGQVRNTGWPLVAGWLKSGLLLCEMGLVNMRIDQQVRTAILVYLCRCQTLADSALPVLQPHGLSDTAACSSSSA